MSGTGPLVGPPDFRRSLVFRGLGEALLGEGLLDEVLLGEAELDDRLLAVFVLKTLSSQASPLPSASRPFGSLGSRSSAAWASTWERKLEQPRWLAWASAGVVGWMSCS